MNLERRTVIKPNLMQLFSRKYFSILLVLGLAISSSAQDISGVWLSPDWYFPGNRRYTEGEVRQTARAVFQKLAKKNVDSVFLETFLSCLLYTSDAADE